MAIAIAIPVTFCLASNRTFDFVHTSYFLVFLDNTHTHTFIRSGRYFDVAIANLEKFPK